MQNTRIFDAMYAILLTFITVSANAALAGRLPTTPAGTDWQANYDDQLDIAWAADADALQAVQSTVINRGFANGQRLSE